MSPNTTPRAATVSFAVRLRSAPCAIASTAIVLGVRAFLAVPDGRHGARVLRPAGTGSTRFGWTTGAEMKFLWDSYVAVRNVARYRHRTGTARPPGRGRY